MKTQSEIPLIFNLFPRHYRTIDDWAGVIPHVKEMGFNSIFVNPFHMTGFSGSLYAVKDYYKLNPLFLNKGRDPVDFTPLKQFIGKCRSAGIDLIMDLVVNHTAFDSVLVDSNPLWYKRDKEGKLVCPFAIDPGNAANVTVWGDLAIIDNENSKDREGLWKYWESMVNFYQDMGFSGFRCDAAYQVPAALWERLIGSAKKHNPQTIFYAETLGCQVYQIEALGNVGFDYLFNSSKWWVFDKPWALEQHEINRKFAPSVAFPESHDTERQASLPPGTQEAQKQRYAFAAVFSKGLMMPMGYEYGAKTRMDVVRGRPEDIDKPQWNISTWIAQLNNLKTSIPVLCSEGIWRSLSDYNLPYIFLEKSSDDGKQKVYFCINKNQSYETIVKDWMIPDEVRKCNKAIQLIASPEKEESVPPAFSLDPADMLFFM